jgi:hypothetical protein
VFHRALAGPFAVVLARRQPVQGEVFIKSLSSHSVEAFGTHGGSERIIEDDGQHVQRETRE